MSDLPKGWSQCNCGCRVPPDKQCPICNSDGKEKKVAIAIDKWKLRVFCKELDKHGFKYGVVNGPTPDTLVLTVVTNDLPELTSVVGISQGRCAALRN